MKLVKICGQIEGRKRDGKPVPLDIKSYDNITIVAKMRHGFLGREAYELVSIEKN